MRSTRITIILLSALPTFAQSESPESDEEQPQEAGQRQREEGSDDEDVDVAEAEPGPEPEKAPPGETVEFYGSGRVVVRSDGNGLSARDIASRVGLFAAKDFARVYTIYARLELGVNIVDAFDRILNPKGNAPEGCRQPVREVGVSRF